MSQRSRRGGPRRGAGRKAGPPEDVRSKRVVVMLTPREYERLTVMADDAQLPIGTLAYELFRGPLERRWERRGK
jgi:hypothetical protein